MSIEIERIELIRKRWRRARAGLHMENTEHDQFGVGHLPPVAGTTRARLLVLPSDPEGTSVAFTEDLWAWWAEERTDPHTAKPTLFGLDTTATSSAAVRFRSMGREDECYRYVALRRDGGLEMGLGKDAVYTITGGFRPIEVFRLINIVGRVAAALDLYAEVISRLGVEGPWEVSLALITTKGTLLGDVAAGWAEAGDANHDGRRCRESSVLLRREVAEWPAGEEALEFAHSIGAEVENAWGSKLRRYLARTGDLTDRFDIDEYRWN